MGPESQRGDERRLDLVARLDRLFVAVVSDCLDQVGLRDNLMAPHIRPLSEDSRTVGIASTVHLISVEEAPANRSDWYKGEIEAIDQASPGDVMVVSSCAESFWGELLATASVCRGIHGVVADAYTRDTKRLREMEFPTFVAGISAQDSLGRADVDSIHTPIECGGVTVASGDLIIADCDGVAVIPKEQAEKVIELAEAKVATEGEMRARLQDGMELGVAFSTYGIL